MYSLNRLYVSPTPPWHAAAWTVASMSDDTSCHFGLGTADNIVTLIRSLPFFQHLPQMLRCCFTIAIACLGSRNLPHAPALSTLVYLTSPSQVTYPLQTPLTHGCAQGSYTAG